MLIRKLTLLNFKNIPRSELDFSTGFNCFVGYNGAGKTNLIDAVYYLSMCKSAFTMTDGQCVCHGNDFFMLDGNYDDDSGGRHSVVCSFKKTAGKTVKYNSKPYERLSDHIGVIPAVIVSPGDVFLINDAADERRKWLNSFISQTDRAYLSAVIRYNHVLAERNKLLKQPGGAAEEILEILDMQLARHGQTINRLRAKAIETLRPVVAEYYRVISGDREEVQLTYRSELNETPFEDILIANRQRDMFNQFTTGGIHRDDMVMKIGGYPLRKYGSQGQQKSFLIALKLAQYTILKNQREERPVLLLDDFFDKLDANRLQALIGLVSTGEFGQVFISDCNEERLVSILNGCGVHYRLFNVADGEVSGDGANQPAEIAATEENVVGQEFRPATESSENPDDAVHDRKNGENNNHEEGQAPRSSEKRKPKAKKS